MQLMVTGLGTTCCLGDDVEAFWAGLLRAAQVPTPAPDDCGMPRHPELYQVTDPLETGRPGAEYGRATGLAVSAVRQAVADAGLTPEQLAEAGLAVGTTLGDLDLVERAEPEAGEWFGVAAAVAARFGIGGPNHSLSTACSAGMYALSWAAELIGTGKAEVVVVCGTDAFSRVAIASLDRLGVWDYQPCRPFDADRQGMVTGEGAAAVVLESAESARQRGATPYAVLEGVGWTCDAYHPTAPEPDGQQLRRAVAAALAESGAVPGAVVLHRSGIAMNDDAESAAIVAALGASIAADLPAYAPKAVIGHTAGAAALFGCVTAALILRHRMVPPNAHVAALDPRCGLDVPVAGPVPLREPRVLVSASGFGGNNAALVLGAAS